MALPDLIEIVPLTEPVRAEITVPGSKSITNRALILAALADGEVTLRGALWSEDTQIMVESLRKLGFLVNVDPDPGEFCNRTITVFGEGGLIPTGGTETQPLELFTGNAGTAARFLAAFVCLGNGVYRLSGVPRMHERPQAALFSALRELGYRVECEFGNDKLPARIYAGGSRDMESFTQFTRRKSAPPAPKKCRVSIVEGSQFASALLMCAKIGNWEVEVVGENAETSPYVAMTSKMLEVFPKNGGTFQIEPDASSGSYFEVIDWIFPPQNLLESYVTVNHWPNSHFQIDEYFLKLRNLTRRASHFEFQTQELVEVTENFTISRKTDLGDSIMTMIVIAPILPRQSSTPEIFRFTDLGRLRVQECERVIALQTELTKCGAKVIEEGDTLTVYPSPLHGAEIETYNDHRMAMCFAVLGLKVPGIKIKNPACVKKTFPNFFQKLATPPPRGLGATILDARTGKKLELDELFAD
jgi:3-phosphoshikimate 1-carboxyvinyltransferase